MGETSKIEWTDATFNPWRGCRALSPACDNCYAKTLVEGRLGESFDARTRAAESTWKQPLAWNRKAAKLGIRYRVFCASLADVFDAEVPDDWRDDLFALIAATPHLDWLLLTKRPKVMRDYLGKLIVPHPLCQGTGCNYCGDGDGRVMWKSHPFPNVWLGTTVENQAMADLRIPHLLETPAAVRFLSCEPLLGPLNLNSDLGGTRWIGGQRGCRGTHQHRQPHEDGSPGHRLHHHHDERCRPGLNWVIAGGESGPKARPSHPDWFRSLRDQCAAAGVPFLMKQWGEWLPGQNEVHPNCDGRKVAHHQNGTWGLLGGKIRAHNYVTWEPNGTLHHGDMRRKHHTVAAWATRVGKKAAGRLLDGVLHDALPEVRS
ncbi:phage Gp37/Gp68 family protein [Azospirillum himalayense]|uniref:Phage Gp37/Gp68 family protein n=1 Tax=Azospirillum himalayense TaxID=654847 RepID=A0ABW0GFH3_9PROT